MISEIKRYWSDGTIKSIFGLLAKRDRRFVLVLVIFQILASVLDIFGIALIGVLGSLAVAGIQSKNPSNLIQGILEQLNISNLTFQQQVAFHYNFSFTSNP